jgi:Arc/MetJ-type ribon-helix-helix transcriptional regulator
MTKNIEYVTIKLPSVVVTELVDPQVTSGQYSSRTEVVKAALRLFFEKYPVSPITSVF